MFVRAARLIYSLLVLSSPASGGNQACAAEFAEAAIAAGHQLHRVFFLDHGSAIGAAGAVFAQDEANPADAWIALAREHDIELVLCVSSALRRGVLDDKEAQRHEKAHPSAHPAFTISGLGQLVDACASSDRIITFGG